MSSSILIIDYGSQYTQLIARRIRELNVYCEIIPFDASDETIAQKAPTGIILSGGPSSVTAEDAPPLSAAVLNAGVPILGICYGLQVLTKTLDGTVGRSSSREYGAARTRCPWLNPIWATRRKRRGSGCRMVTMCKHQRQASPS